MTPARAAARTLAACFFVVALFLVIGTSRHRVPVAQFYVAPDGKPDNAGTLASPWDAATAFGQPAAVRPGSTIWVRGGVYKGPFHSQLTGTASDPIIVRNYSGERATFDNPTDCSGYVINGSYSWHWGLELTSSGKKRRTTWAGSDCKDPEHSMLDRGLGFRNNGSYTRIINSVVHDTQNGVSNWGTWTSGPGLEVYGTLIYYNGFIQTGEGLRGHGHGTYTLSKSNGATRLIDNILHTQFSTGIRMGDEGVFNPHIEGNISYLNGEHITPMGGRNLYVGGMNNYEADESHSTYVVMKGALIKDNYTYYREQPDSKPNSPKAGNPGASEGLNAGLWWPGASGQIIGNYLAGYGGGHALQLGYWDHFTATACRGNTVYGSANAYAKRQCPSDSNTYLSSTPAANAVFVRPNRYETGRAHIAVYNWQNLPSVTVDLAASGLANGEAFEVRDAMNFYGKPVASGRFATATPTVSIPMTGLVRSRLEGEDDIPAEYVPGPHSAPQFGAFVVLPLPENPPPPPPAS